MAISQNLNILTREKILAGIATFIPAENFYFYEETDSTNIRAQELLNTDGADAEFIAVASASQSAGRGRFDRKWEDKKGASICLSLAFSLKNKQVKNLHKFGLLAGIEICLALREKTGGAILLKWPNDLYFGSKKLGGMIASAQSKNGKIDSIIFGVGVNFAQVGEHKNFSDLTSISIRQIEINSICAELIKSTIKAFKRLENEELVLLSKEFAPLDFLRGKSLSLTDFTNSYSGIANGVSDDGDLILEDANKNIFLYKAGETSILKD